MGLHSASKVTRLLRTPRFITNLPVSLKEFNFNRESPVDMLDYSVSTERRGIVPREDASEKQKVGPDQS